MKEYLSQKGIAYEEHDVGADEDAVREMFEKTKQMGVPVMIIDDKQIIKGFNQSELDELLA